MRMVSRLRYRTNQSLTLLSQLEEDQTDDQEVTLADQTNINAFSKLNNRSEELTDLLETLKRELEELEEVETEIELMDDEELVMSVYPHSRTRLDQPKLSRLRIRRNPSRGKSQPRVKRSLISDSRRL